jgi:hypothetical protein
LEEVPVMVTTYCPAGVLVCDAAPPTPVCDAPPAPTLVPPAHEIMAVASAMRMAAETTCPSRSESDDTGEFGLKKAKARRIVAKTPNHTAIRGPGPIGAPQRSKPERAAVGTVTVNV